MLKNFNFYNYSKQEEEILTSSVKRITKKCDNELSFCVHKEAFLYGQHYTLYDKNGDRIKESSLKRGINGNHTNDIVPTIDLSKHKVSKEIENVIYLGPLFYHYGHFLLESTARLWSIFDHYLQKKEDFVFLFHCKIGLKAMPSFVKYFLSFFKDIRIEIISGEFNNSLIRLKNVIIPDPSLIADYSINRKYSIPFNFIAKQITSTKLENSNEKICFLSRLSLDSTTRKALGEYSLTKLMHEKIEIFNPQDFSLEHQIINLNSHKTIIGIIGSAFHTLLFLTSKAPIYLTDSRPNINFLAIDFILYNKPKYIKCIFGRNEKIYTPISGRLPKLLDITVVANSVFNDINIPFDQNVVECINNLNQELYQHAFEQSMESFSKSKLVNHKISVEILKDSLEQATILILTHFDSHIPDNIYNTVINQKFTFSSLNVVFESIVKNGFLKKSEKGSRHHELIQLISKKLDKEFPIASE